MGDALTKIRNLNIGMPDTGTYFTDEEFITGFKKSMKFQPRVIKQNRGSSGEGIWIINLKKADYCAAYGDATVEDSDELILMEANDNHVENHTVLEFINWCLYGRDEGKGAGEWASKGTGKYLEGGKAAGGQLTDQRFCGRILEGEDAGGLKSFQREQPLNGLCLKFDQPRARPQYPELIVVSRSETPWLRR